MIFNRRFLSLLPVLGTLLASPPVCVAEEALRPFDALYRAINGKRKVKMTVRLSQESDEVYAHNMEIKIFIVGTVRRTALMRRKGDRLFPLYSGGGLGKRTETYEWDDDSLVYTGRKGQQRTLGRDGSEHDENSMQYDISLQLALIGADDEQALRQWRGSYKVSFNRGESWSLLQMAVRDIAPISTAMGEVECVNIAGQSDDGKYRIVLSLAPSMHWIPVRYSRQGETVKDIRSSNLLSVTFAQKPQ